MGQTSWKFSATIWHPTAHMGIGSEIKMFCWLTSEKGNIKTHKKKHKTETGWLHTTVYEINLTQVGGEKAGSFRINSTEVLTIEVNKLAGCGLQKYLRNNNKTNKNDVSIGTLEVHLKSVKSKQNNQKQIGSESFC